MDCLWIADGMRAKKGLQNFVNLSNYGSGLVRNLKERGVMAKRLKMSGLELNVKSHF